MSAKVNTGATAIEAPAYAVEAVRTYIAARETADRAKRAKERADEALDNAETELLRAFEREGVQSIRLDGRLVSLTRTLWARVNQADRDRAATLLREHGLDFLVDTTIGAQRLSSWVRERDRDGEALPADLAGVIQVSEKIGLSMRKG